MAKLKRYICYSHQYTKLKKDAHTTVRWLDSVYVLGEFYEEFTITNSLFHTKIGRGNVRVVKLEIKKLSDLSDEFILEDADCDRETFYRMMQNWYHRKPDWKCWDSEVQIIYLERVK